MHQPRSSSTSTSTLTGFSRTNFGQRSCNDAEPDRCAYSLTCSAAPTRGPHAALQPTRSAHSHPCGSRDRIAAASGSAPPCRCGSLPRRRTERASRSGFASAVPRHAGGRRCSTRLRRGSRRSVATEPCSPDAALHRVLALRLRRRGPAVRERAACCKSMAVATDLAESRRSRPTCLALRLRLRRPAGGAVQHSRGLAIQADGITDRLGFRCRTRATSVRRSHCLPVRIQDLVAIGAK